jgi:hypothetical protein
MSEKTTAWTAEELHEIQKRRYQDNLAAYELDPKGRPIRLKGREWSWQDHLCPEYEYCADCVSQAADETAAVVFGLMAMAHAIRARHVYEHHCSRCASVGDLCRFCCFGG